MLDHYKFRNGKGSAKALTIRYPGRGGGGACVEMKKIIVPCNSLKKIIEP